MVGKSSLIAFFVGLMALIAHPAIACTYTGIYRSVVVNKAPEHVQGGAVVLKVRVDKALHSAEKQEIQGLRATTLEAVRGIPSAAQLRSN
jgi:hypothetical protein